MELFTGFLGVGLVLFGSLYCLWNLPASYRSVSAAHGPWKSRGRRRVVSGNAVETVRDAAALLPGRPPSKQVSRLPGASGSNANLTGAALEMAITVAFLVTAAWFAIDVFKVHRLEPPPAKVKCVVENDGRRWVAPSGAEGLLFTDGSSARTGADFSSQPLTDADLERLFAEIPRITTLLAGDTRLTESGISRLGTCKHLEYLVLNGLPATDENLACLAKLDRLSVLSLSRTNISARGLQHLESLPTLRELRLCQTDLDDSSLESLRRMRGLELVDLSGVCVSASEIAELKEALPRCGIICVASGQCSR